MNAVTYRLFGPETQRKFALRQSLAKHFQFQSILYYLRLRGIVAVILLAVLQASDFHPLLEWLPTFLAIKGFSILRSRRETDGSMQLKENIVMKKRIFHIVIGAAVLALAWCALQVSQPARANAQAAPDPHMAMTKLHPLEAGDNARAETILIAARKFAERYRDYRKAEADGFTIFMPEQHQNVYHFVLENEDSGAKGFDPDHPHVLLYTKTDGPNPRYELVGVMYTAPYDSTREQLNARVPLSIARWHIHLNMCIPPQPERHDWLMEDPKFGLNGSITTAAACSAAGGRFKPHLAGWMTHIYPFETDPSKIWGMGMDDHHGIRQGSMPSMKM
jgi:hypothetical protein